MSDTKPKNIKQEKIAVLGAGSFGTALAILLAKNGNPTSLWGRDSQQLESIQEKGINQKYLPDIKLPNSLLIESNLEKALDQAKDILVVTPSHTFSDLLTRIKPLMGKQSRLVWACKGLEPETNDFLQYCVTDILGEEFPKAVLSGPTFARELAMGMPTAITLASDDIDFAMDLSERLANETFRVYLSTDLKGVQLAGALKNVIAIGTGISDGLGFGSNARTALITRGLAEMMRIGERVGGFQETYVGLSGLGDLILTCTDNQSRNRRFGLALGKGASMEQAIEQIGQVVEGVRNTKEFYQLAKKHRVDMPICQAIYSILYENQDPKQAARDLLSRTLKVEGE